MIYIQYKFTGLNEYTNSSRANKFKSSSIKKRETEIARLHFLNAPKIDTPCRLKFTWIMKTKRMDLDNKSFSKKMIIDGMVKANVIPDDTLKYVIGFQDEYEIGTQDGVRIEVI